MEVRNRKSSEVSQRLDERIADSRRRSRDSVFFHKLRAEGNTLPLQATSRDIANWWRERGH